MLSLMMSGMGVEVVVYHLPFWYEGVNGRTLFRGVLGGEGGPTTVSSGVLLK